jgi:two-component system sensor histidine kinase QseC
MSYKTRSIRSRLLVLIFSLLIALWAIVLAFQWYRTHVEINGVYDDQLVRIARLVSVVALHEQEEHDMEDMEYDLQLHGHEYPVIFQVWSRDWKLLVRGPGSPRHPISEMRDDGFSDVVIDGEKWRVYGITFPGQVYLVQVAHNHAERDALILDFVISTVQPMFLVLPLLGLVWFGIVKGLAPLEWVARQVSSRDSANLDPMPIEQVPAEVSVLVNEINAVFFRLDEALKRYSRFTSNAAHELRTPLAGAITQAYIALNAQTEEERFRSLNHVITGLRNLHRMVEQMLTLARIDPLQLRDTFVPLNLNDVAIDVLSDLYPKAAENEIELELEAQANVGLQGDRELLSVLLRNLVENAMRAVAQAGKVTVSILPVDGLVCMSVVDTGPGIPAAEQSAVFDRFHRVSGTPGPGSGLGLSIVKAVAEAHAATIELTSPAADGRGLKVAVMFQALDDPSYRERPAETGNERQDDLDGDAVKGVA